MRVRTIQPFPWLEEMPAGNAAEWEPFTFTLKESMEYYWRVQEMSIECEFTATCDDVTPGDARTYNVTIACSRYSIFSSAAIADGSEIELLGDGPANGDDALWRGQDSQTVAAWLSAAGTNSVNFNSDLKMWTPGSAGSRGTWLPADPLTVAPSCNIGFTANVSVSGSGLMPPTLTVSTIDPGAGTHTGNFVTNIFGENVTFYWVGEPGDYAFTWDDVDIVSITKTGWYSYSGVWDPATGAQLLDPRTASVP